jgi:cytochrome c oxidase subunit I
MSDALHIQPGTVIEHGVHPDDHHGHHKESFVSKYIFSMDHKTIGKQFLITGIIWAIIGSWKLFLVSGPRVARSSRNFIMP